MTKLKTLNWKSEQRKKKVFQASSSAWYFAMVQVKIHSGVEVCSVSGSLFSRLPASFASPMLPTKATLAGKGVIELRDQDCITSFFFFPWLWSPPLCRSNLSKLYLLQIMKQAFNLNGHWEFFSFHSFSPLLFLFSFLTGGVLLTYSFWFAPCTMHVQNPSQNIRHFWILTALQQKNNLSIIYSNKKSSWTKTSPDQQFKDNLN